MCLLPHRVASTMSGTPTRPASWAAFATAATLPANISPVAGPPMRYMQIAPAPIAAASAGVTTTRWNSPESAFQASSMTVQSARTTGTGAPRRANRSAFVASIPADSRTPSGPLSTMVDRTSRGPGPDMGMRSVVPWSNAVMNDRPLARNRRPRRRAVPVMGGCSSSSRGAGPPT